jgi:hypothetical protein
MKMTREKNYRYASSMNYVDCRKKQRAPHPFGRVKHKIKISNYRVRCTAHEQSAIIVQGRTFVPSLFGESSNAAGRRGCFYWAVTMAMCLEQHAGCITPRGSRQKEKRLRQQLIEPHLNSSLDQSTAVTPHSEAISIPVWWAHAN